MNKYIVPICNINNGEVWIKTIIAKSNSDCQEKIMEDFLNQYDLEEVSDYRKLTQILDTDYDILIGEIKDVEEL